MNSYKEQELKTCSFFVKKVDKKVIKKLFIRQFSTFFLFSL